MKDVENEIHSIERLCQRGSHKNIVAHGRLDGGFYYMNMELCDLSLHDYIYQLWTPEMLATVAYLTVDQPPRMRMSQIWNILQDITDGLTYVHHHGLVH